MDLFRFTPGTTPLLVSVPHAGTHVPEAIRQRLTPAAAALPDTDWHVDRLYDFVTELGAGLLVATHSRYVVDLNRDPHDRPLYPGASNTEVCPSATFDNEPIYAGAPPDAVEIPARVARYWQPYHDQLAAELQALKRRHGVAVLFDAHSIRSVLPRFFAGRLPDLNLGTAKGASIDADLEYALVAVLESAAPHYSSILNGRFTGGYITRQYGRPGDAIHAVQLEMAQRVYMNEEPPYAYRSDRAEGIRPALRGFVTTLRDWALAKA